MKPDYKNWVPKGMVWGFAGGFAAALALFVIFGCTPLLAKGTFKTMLTVILLAGTIFLGISTIWIYKLHKAFDYNGERKMSKQIIDGIADALGLVELDAIVLELLVGKDGA